MPWSDRASPAEFLTALLLAGRQLEGDKLRSRPSLWPWLRCCRAQTGAARLTEILWQMGKLPGGDASERNASYCLSARGSLTLAHPCPNSRVLAKG